MFALVLSIGTMSFKLAENNHDTATIYWYERNDDGSYSQVDEPDTACDEANNQICALGFDSSQPVVNDGMEGAAPHKRYKP